nr:uncharacterized protein LOC113728748 [Coffea arabica]
MTPIYASSLFPPLKATQLVSISVFHALDVVFATTFDVIPSRYYSFVLASVVLEFRYISVSIMLSILIQHPAFANCSKPLRETTCSSSNNHVCCDVINGPSSEPSTRGHQEKVKKRNQRIDRIPTQPSVLPFVQDCVFCGAKRFYLEPPGFCCASGEIRLVETEMPAQLAKLYTANTPEAIEFRQCIRSYNNMFAFTSLGVHSDKELNKRDRGIYAFRVQGQMYHFLNPLVPMDGHKPSNVQLYYFDTEHEIANRMAISNKFRETILQQLQQLLDHNPYAAFFRSLRNFEDIYNHKVFLNSHPSLDQRVYNTPTVSQVAAIWTEHDLNIGDSSQHIQGHNMHIRRHSSAEEIISAENAVLQKKKKKRTTVSCREYYCYKFQMHEIDKSLLLHCGRLFQQFCIDTYVKIESARLDFHRNRQRQIRTDVYQGILDSIANGETSGSNVGRRIYLPASFIGGPRDMKRRYMDTMTLVQRYGKPDIFLTMTCNPAWPEIKKHLSDREEAHNRPDVTARKRGLPHAHFLIILANGWKLDSPEAYDRVVSAELPDPASFPYLHSVVVAHMLHRPCGTANKNSPCMKQNGKCKFAYPKDFAEFTRHNKNSYPLYMRRYDQKTVTARHFQFDNRWVVPYNPYLLAKYDCHINVELNAAENDEAIDEIKNFQSGRWICAPEAAWRIFAFDLSNLNPSVMPLQIHLEGEQSMVSNEDDILERVVVDEQMSRTMLTEFFRMNSADGHAKELKCLYKDFPQHFVWNATHKIWEPRQRRSTIGRLTTVHPTQGEKYYLRMLLMHVRGPKSYESLKHIGSRTASIFREAAEILGLLKIDDSAEQCLLEAVSFQMPYTLRHLFALILVYVLPPNPMLLWQKFEPYLSEDISKDKSLSAEQIRLKVLQLIDSHLQYMGKHLADFKIVVPNTDDFSIQRDTQEIEAELDIKVSTEDIASVALLNPHQRSAYNKIINSIDNNTSAAFFIDGPGGTSKTFLYKALLATVRSKGQIALATASCGVAASILPGGRIAHSRFKIPIHENDDSACNVNKQSSSARLIKQAKLIKATMAKKYAIECFDKLLRDIMDLDTIFGGKVVVFGGDFRQTLLVVVKGYNEDYISASLCSDTNIYIVPFKRTQFPVRLCFAMTINKAQGQTLDFVGLYLKEPVFGHGQLYVALSRAKTVNDVRVLVRPSPDEQTDTVSTRNIVYNEVISITGVV